ncbi:MAG: hypothetical protein K0Q81_1015 [Paenibacillus sp.]|jgi:hypothetical protein|nr:hypothetical protein [Paenibacillus sp.]
MLNLEQYVGTVAELIYMDREKRITQRHVMIRKCSDKMLEVFCLQRKQPRSLRMDGILAVRTVNGKAKQIG